MPLTEGRHFSETCDQFRKKPEFELKNIKPFKQLIYGKFKLKKNNPFFIIILFIFFVITL